MFFTLMSGVFLYFILVYFYKDKIKGSKWIYLIFIIPVIAFIGGLTDPWLHLVYVPIVTSTGIVFKRNIIANVCNFYGTAVIFVVFLIIVINLYKPKSSRKKKASYFFIIC